MSQAPFLRQISKLLNVLNSRIHIHTFIIASLLFSLIITLLIPFNIDDRWRYATLPEYSMSKDVIIVGIDDSTVETYGGWPFARSELTSIIDVILNSRPKQVGVDIVFQSMTKSDVDTQLNTLLRDSRVTTAISQFPLNVFDTSILKDARVASTRLNLSSNGVVYKVQTKYDDKRSFGSAISQKTESELPSEFYLNPNTTLPPVISVKDLMNNPSLSSLLNDKYVLLGSTSKLLGDYIQIPKYNYVPGIVVHSLILNQILQNRYTRTLQFSPFLSIALSLMVAFVLSLKMSDNRQSYIWAFCIISVIIIWFTPLLSYISLSFLFSLTTGLIISFALINIGHLLYDKIYERRMLQGYFSAPVMNKVLARSNGLDLGGEKNDISVMFTDLRGFTKFSEEVDPKQVGDILNEVLGKQADIIIHNQGVVDKYIGDSVMSFWGAPLGDQHHCYKALKTACIILTTFNELKEVKKYSFDIGIGLNAGDAVVGNFGSSQRFNYTVIGDMVNTASRIESLTKHYNKKILLGESIYQKLSSKHKQLFRFELVDTVKPRGKNQTINIYTVSHYFDRGKWHSIEAEYSIKYVTNNNLSAVLPG